MYESKVSTVKSEWDQFSVMRNSNVKSPAFIPVPCPTHSDYSITNICKSPGCIEPLCPECITAHVQLHQQTKKPAKIENIINTRVSCIQKLGQILQEANSEYQKFQKSCGANLQTFLEKNRKRLEFAKNKLENFVSKYFEEIQQKLELLEVAYINQKEKKSKQIKAKAAPLLHHMEQISQYKLELQSEDYIPALIELLNDPPKKPPTIVKMQFEDFGQVRIDEYSFQTLKTSLQSFVSVQSNLPVENKFTEQINRNSSRFSNQMKFSRLGRSSSRQLMETQLQNSRNQANLDRSNSRKKIFSNEKRGGSANMINSSMRISNQFQKESMGIPKLSVTFQNAIQDVETIDYNYFMYDKGLLAYFPENQKHFYAVDALYIQKGFERVELSDDLIVPFDHQCVITPDSRIFLFGGRYSSKSLSQCYEILMKPSLPGKSRVRKLQNMKEGRARFSSVYYKDCIYVFGGKRQGSLISSCEKYHVSTDKWETIETMPQPLMSMNVCRFNDKMIKFGGIQENGQILNRIDIYHPETNTWLKFPSQIPFFVKMGCCQLNSSQVLIFGGQTQFNSKRNQCFVLREDRKNELKVFPSSSSLYNEGSFEASYVYKNALLAMQNGESNKNKIVMKLQNGKWRFLAC